MKQERSSSARVLRARGESDSSLRSGSTSRTTYVLASAVLLLTLLTAPVVRASQPEPLYEGSDRIEDWTGKKILVFTPHPDDETFTSGGTLAMLKERGNEIRIVIYTTDNAGSRDPSMTHERLAGIRKSEEEEACRILGIEPEALVWLGHDDGMLEYVDRRELTRQAAREIRRFQPDALFSVDPGSPYEQYHKSDHRSGAIITVDAIRAARWRLYFPELEAEGHQAWSVPLVFFYYSASPNYTVDITKYAERKARASAAHRSQFGSNVDRYLATPPPGEQEALVRSLLQRAAREGDRYVERFRRSTAY